MSGTAYSPFISNTFIIRVILYVARVQHNVFDKTIDFAYTFLRLYVFYRFSSIYAPV